MKKRVTVVDHWSVAMALFMQSINSINLMITRPGLPPVTLFTTGGPVPISRTVDHFVTQQGFKCEFDLPGAGIAFNGMQDGDQITCVINRTPAGGGPPVGITFSGHSKGHSGISAGLHGDRAEIDGDCGGAGRLKGGVEILRQVAGAALNANACRIDLLTFCNTPPSTPIKRNTVV
eukprot:TRINITY_DN60253_c0_g3_i1.p1 TRINITY_DN60253_c0_g3~~TRINITY_DN60253_c0_g3_i1.p1  ORF type:complete len:176 (-),score=28.27 TRINITY_DN60253_c0_g3_i1:80-607(-)